MDSGFQLAVDPERSLLRLSLAGFFDVDDVARFAAERQAAHEKLRCRPNAHVTLVDVSACKIQPQVVLPIFARIIEDPTYRGRRLAFVTGRSLAKMQLLRLLQGQPHARAFDDIATAQAWLMEDQPLSLA